MLRNCLLSSAVALAMAISAGAATAQSEPRPAEAGRGWLGILVDPAGTEGAVVVKEVFRESPARRAGIAEGDTVLLWDGRRDVAAATRERTLDPGDTVRLRVRRPGERDRDVALVAGRRPSALTIRRGGDGGEVYIFDPRSLQRDIRIFSDSLAITADSMHQRLQLLMRDSLGPRIRELELRAMPEIRERMLEIRGMPPFNGEPLVFDIGRRAVAGAEFAEVNEGLGSYFGTTTGAVVLNVAPETPAARAGLRSGDVVVEVDGAAVATVAELRAAVSRAQARDTRRVELQILRRGERSTLVMRWD